MEANAVSHVLTQIRPFLTRFLVDHKIIDGERDYGRAQFKCPNPEHNDGTPSAVVLPNGQKAYCHGCHATFDIFHLNHWINKAPLSGFAFVTNNLVPLAQKYEVEFELGSLSEDERFKLDSIRACQLAVDYMSTHDWPEAILSYITERGLDVDSCLSLGVYGLNDYDGLLLFLREFFPLAFLQDVGFGKKSMFSDKSLIFTIKDPSGTPVGFISRDIDHERKKEQYELDGKRGAPPRKYDSSPEKNRIYFKRQNLFGFDSLLRTKLREAFIFEGQFDWAIAQKYGIHNSVALSGHALTEEHVQLFRKHDINSLVLALDSDDAGRHGVSKLLLGDGKEPGILINSSLRVSVLELPEGHDPHSFILEFGVEAFHSLNRVSAFEWALNQQNASIDPVAACEVMLPFIVMETSHLRRETMIKTLSDNTGLSIASIMEEVSRLENQGSLAINREIQELLVGMQKELKHTDLRDAAFVLKTIAEQIDNVTVIKSADVYSQVEILDALDEQVRTENENSGPQGYRYGALRHFEQDLNGDMNGQLIGFGGTANSGKTSLFAHLAKELLDNNDLIVIVHTIDDNRVQFNRRLMTLWAQEEAHKIGSPLAAAITLNKVGNPTFWTTNFSSEHNGLLELKDHAYQKQREYIRSGRLYVKDTTHGPTLSFLGEMTKRIRRENPHTPIAIILDNFHKLSDFSNLDERMAVLRRSRTLKTDIIQNLGCTGFSTFEYTKIKTGDRATNTNIREAVNVEYDANYLIHLHSPLKAAIELGKVDSCEYWHGSPDDKLPVIEGTVGKNKVSELKGGRYFKFFPSQSRYECISDSELNLLIARNRNLSENDEDEPEGMWKNGKYVKLNGSKRDSTLDNEDPIPF